MIPERKVKIRQEPRTLARERALQALYQWHMTQQDVQTIEVQFLADAQVYMRKADMAYFQQLLHQIPQHIDVLDELLVTVIDRSVARVDLIELTILRMGCYELRYCPEIPWRVVINEAVELAKKFGAEKSHKYINGVLDKIARHLQTASHLSPH